MSQIVILSGVPASGKSAIAESLCERYDRTVHLETDALYAWIRMGYVAPWKPASDRQNYMVSRAAARAATAYAQDLYAVFIDGVIGPHLLPVYLEELRAAGVPVHFVRLMTSLEETVRRGLVREAVPRVPEDLLRTMHATFERYGDFAGCTVDTTGLTPDQAADLVMAMCGEGACLVLPGPETFPPK